MCDVNGPVTLAFGVADLRLAVEVDFAYADYAALTDRVLRTDLGPYGVITRKARDASWWVIARASKRVAVGLFSGKSLCIQFSLMRPMPPHEAGAKLFNPPGLASSPRGYWVTSDLLPRFRAR
jgi:hypothetical protein